MSTKSSGHDADLESQQTALLVANNTPRERWRCILLMLQERNLIPRADTAEKGSAFDKVSSSMSSYSIISAGDIGVSSQPILFFPQIFVVDGRATLLCLNLTSYLLDLPPATVTTKKLSCRSRSLIHVSCHYIFLF